MMPTKKLRSTILLCLAFGLLCCGLAQAGSSYSRYGYGLLYLRDGVKAIAMGGTGLAMSDSVTLFYLNPATLASVRITHIQGAAIYDRADVSFQGSSALFHDVRVNGLGILIPLKRGHALTFGLQPYSQVNYLISESKTVDEKDLEQSLTATGGLDVFYLALASTIGPVQLGVASDFYFGLIRETWRVNFRSGEYRYTEDRLSTNFRGFGVHAGLHTRLKNWQIGLALGTPVNLSGEKRVDTRSADDQNPEPAKSKLPLWYGVGLAYRAGAHLQLAAEARSQRWGSLSSADLLGASGVDNYTLGLGLEFTPGKDRLREGKSWHYRAGANFSLLPYREESGSTIPEWTVAAGIGVPFNRGTSSIDFAVEWGQRGDSANLAQEDILRLSFSLNGSERWFQRRR